MNSLAASALWQDKEKEQRILRDSLAPEDHLYFYHPDHLGSSSWITYTDGTSIQHLHYLPWGESFVDQRISSFGSRYTFSAKEKDVETGYGYFGSRYYSSDLSIWLSVDPMADKYPSMSAYVYCADNPVKLVDPNGEEVVITGNDADEAKAQLQNKSNLTLSRDAETGRLSYEGKAKTKTDRMLKKAIDSENVTVNISANNSDKFTAHDGEEYTYEKDDDGLIGGGAYGGSTVSSLGEINSYQYICPKRMAEMDKRVGDENCGGYMLHEVAEGFASAKRAYKTGLGDMVGGSRYNTVHNQANKYSGGNWQKVFERNDVFNFKSKKFEEKIIFKNYIRTP